MSNFYQEFLDDASNFEDTFPYSYNYSWKSWLIRLGHGGLIKFGSVALAHPFEEARILRQVQYGTAVDVIEAGGFCEVFKDSFSQERNEFNNSGTSNDADDERDPFFLRRSQLELEKEAQLTDEHFRSSGIKGISSSHLKIEEEHSKVEVDDQGYAKSSKSSPTSCTTNWPLILNKKASIWASLMLAVKYQGIASVWTGVFSFWAYQMAFDVNRAALEEVLASEQMWRRPGGLLGYVYEFPSSKLPVADSPFPTIPVTASVMIYSAAAFLLTPIDLVRTRLAVQSIYASEVKTKSLYSALQTIYKEEGGLSALYPHTMLNLFSSLLAPSLRILPLTLFTHFCESWIEGFGIPSGVTFAIAQFLVNSLTLTVNLPIETVRRRLFLQSSRTVSKAWIYRVPISPQPYRGFWNCLRRICQEEGVGALYQGWTMQLASNTLMLGSKVLLEFENELPDEMEAF